VYELYSRTLDLVPGSNNIQKFHEDAKLMARAETQSFLLRGLFALSNSNITSSSSSSSTAAAVTLTCKFAFSKREKEVLRNGRNRSSRGPLRVSQQVYSECTALETLLGYLYLKDQFRLQVVLDELSRLRTSCSIIPDKINWN
jgi:23S rRNA maturation mini-RNase III